MDTAVTCVKCKTPLVSRSNPEAASIFPFNSGTFSPCPSCGAKEMVEVFPALYRTAAYSGSGEKIVSAEEASCFYHPQKRASRPCDSCGRFLCDLCDLELNGKHICPSCLQTGRKKGKIRNLDNERICYDKIALKTAILPPLLMVTWMLSAVTAPIALYLSIRYWNAPVSIVTRSAHLRFVIAIVFSVIQIIGWILFIYFAFNPLHYTHPHR